MPKNNHPETKQKNHIDENDVARAERETGETAPLKSNENDAHVPDTELTNHPKEAQENAEENDPTAGKSPSH